jgi:cation diffusion facilitator CzcD-associated flavoprotein CzcO
MVDVRARTPAGSPTDVDAVVVGAGFAGLYALHKLRDDLHLRVQAFEAGDGVGGTWFWNRYPGARCDSESYFYCYSFSPELASEWEWSRRYPDQPEIERYLNHVADRFDLRRDLQLSTRVDGARFDEANDCWAVHTDRGATVTARFLIAAVGCLSTPIQPDLPGLDDFEGDVYLTATWPRAPVDLTGRRVALVGTGSSGIQVTPQLAAVAEHLTVFQRTPNYSLPAQDHVLDSVEQADVKARYDEIFDMCRQTYGGYPYQMMERSTFSVTPEEREEIFERLWGVGGFRFFWGGFSDMMTDPEANEVTCEFVRKKIRETVKDPRTAELLCPKGYPYGAKRPPIDTGYYETFNRDNVTLVDVSDCPIEAVTRRGLRTARAEHGEYDVLVFATGFDAMTGSLERMNLRGCGGLQLRDAWADGPRTFLGLQTAGFPNLFTITGPGSPSVLLNMPVAIEHHVEWIAECLEHMRAHGWTRVEATDEAQSDWTDHVALVGEYTLFSKGSSWWVGANVPGKPRVLMPYAGGQPMYRARCDEVVRAGYEGFRFS